MVPFVQIDDKFIRSEWRFGDQMSTHLASVDGGVDEILLAAPEYPSRRVNCYSTLLTMMLNPSHPVSAGQVLRIGKTTGSPLISPWWAASRLARGIPSG